MTTNVLVTHYSSTGSVFRLAEAVIAGAEKAGADVRLRRVPELAPTRRSLRTPLGLSTSLRRPTSKRCCLTTSAGPMQSCSGRRPGSGSPAPR
jgi:hypothetical protein